MQIIRRSTVVTFFSTAFFLTLFSSGVLGAASPESSATTPVAAELAQPSANQPRIIPQTQPITAQPQLNINISTAGTQWFEAYPPNDNPQILMMFRSPIIHKSVQPTLTVRRDKAQPEDDLKKYAHRWTKEMSRFGIKVLGTQFFSQGDQVGYAVDLTPEGSVKRQRQTLFIKNQDVVILTCTAHKEEFKSSLKDCNRIIENFSWNLSANHEDASAPASVPSGIRAVSPLSNPPAALELHSQLKRASPQISRPVEVQKTSSPSVPNQKASSKTL